jgi:hypothetical protein
MIDRQNSVRKCFGISAPSDLFRRNRGNESAPLLIAQECGRARGTTTRGQFDHKGAWSLSRLREPAGCIAIAATKFRNTEFGGVMPAEPFGKSPSR